MTWRREKRVIRSHFMEYGISRPSSTTYFGTVYHWKKCPVHNHMTSDKSTTRDLHKPIANFPGRKKGSAIYTWPTKQRKTTTPAVSASQPKKSDHHGSGTSEEEEEVFDSEGQNEAKVKESQSSRQCDHRRELVYSSSILSTRLYCSCQDSNSQYADGSFHRNQNETLTQNYRRLGLTSRLNSATGGVEKLRAGEMSKTSTTNKLAISNSIPKTIEPTEARVERDPESGKILRVIHPTSRPNPLNDPLNSDSDHEDMADGEEEFEGFGEDSGTKMETNDIVRKLEEQASMGAEKKERRQSDREREWIGRLVGKYGEDFQKMARDLRLNPMQQTPADIRRRIEKWKASGRGATVEV
jgi:nucleolar protein 16